MVCVIHGVVGCEACGVVWCAVGSAVRCVVCGVVACEVHGAFFYLRCVTLLDVWCVVSFSICGDARSPHTTHSMAPNSTHPTNTTYRASNNAACHSCGGCVVCGMGFCWASAEPHMHKGGVAGRMLTGLSHEHEVNVCLCSKFVCTLRAEVLGVSRCLCSGRCSTWHDARASASIL